MKLLDEYTTAHSTETQRVEGVGACDPHSTPMVSGTRFNWNTAYPEPCNTVLASAGISPVEQFADLLMEPDWAATALRSRAWDFWKAEEEDVYGPEDGQPL
jgi:hypothetical protein